MKQQIRENFVALISLIVALYALWSSEMIDKRRTLRAAGFEVLKNLGELQMIVNDVHYNDGQRMYAPFSGWGRIALISDLSELLPQPVPETVEKLVEVWNADWKQIETNDAATQAISNQIDASRKVVLDSVRRL